MDLRRLRAVRIAVGVLVLPHELGHALVARLCGLDPEITLLPSWDGETVPLARFDARLTPDTPTLCVRAVAVGPLPLAVAAAGLLGTAVHRDSSAAIPLLAALSLWGSLSAGDLAVALEPRVAREQGSFLVPDPPRVGVVATCLIPLTVLLVGVLLFR